MTPPFAVFAYWWDTKNPAFPPFPQFHLFTADSSAPSTVNKETLVRLGVEVPAFPTFDEWTRGHK